MEDSNQAGNPNLINDQSPRPRASARAGTIVTVFRPPAPDLVIYRFQAIRGRQELHQWALALKGTADYLQKERSADWRPAGQVGRCYSRQLEGTLRLFEWQRNSPDDPNHEDHFYAASSEQVARGDRYYGGASRREPEMCFVVRYGAGAENVTEWWKGSDGHYYTTGNDKPPGPGWQDVPQWATW